MEFFSNNTLILTPNQRLSTVILKEYHQLQQQNNNAWMSHKIYPYTVWIQQLWREYATANSDSPLVLSAQQENILWHDIVKRSPMSEHLLQPAKTAELAKSAWVLLKQWQVDIHDSRLKFTEDGEIMQQWAYEFIAHCKENHWIDTNTLIDILSKQITQKTITIPYKIVLYGFTDLIPQLAYFIDQCARAGSQIEHYAPSNCGDTIKKICLPDEEAEIKMMAQWAKATYHHSTDKKSFLIGCIIPQLESLREKVLQIFSEVFSEENTINLDHSILPFNISAGKSLHAYPIIYTALQILGLPNKTFAAHQFSPILLSPFIGAAEQEQSRRAMLDFRLRNEQIKQIALDYFVKQDSYLHASCPMLAKSLQKFLNHIPPKDQLLKSSEWAIIFSELLHAIGWPGERSLVSQEYQVVQRWLKVLSEFQGLDHILPALHYHEACEHLEILVTKTIFQPQTPEAPIQILGALEAAQVPFEYAWVMGMDDSTWPAAPKPNPFIPVFLQKQLNMPHATAERELHYCKKLMEQYKQSNRNIIFSYAAYKNDIDSRPSALLNEVEEISQESLSIKEQPSVKKILFHTKKIESFVDDFGAALTDMQHIRGGTSLFKQQAICPFKAYAELRLHARKMESPLLGISTQDRGSITHKALELFWKTIKNSVTLKALNKHSLENIVYESVEKAITSIIDSNNYNTKYIQLEQQRLATVLMQWLEYEKSRPDFSVTHIEHEIEMIIDNIKVQLRIDRIDTLTNGDMLIIDYKTGKNNYIKNWFGDRPTEPQLPLYCISDDLPISGIAFAQIHPDDISLKGVYKNSQDITNIKNLAEIPFADNSLWEQQINTWKKTLHGLARDFTKGFAKVNPKDKNESCRQCHLHSLCRIHELST